MGRIGLAFRVFFRALGNAAFAEQLTMLMEGKLLPAPWAKSATNDAATKASTPETPPPPERPKSAPPARSEAITFLATLQREARFIDFVQEQLADYTDAQIAAAARDVHRDCRATIDRLFGIGPLVTEAEGATIDVPAGFDAARYRLTGKVAGQPPYRGSLQHHGWVATRCELPAWTGGRDAALVVAPAEVELS
jgi:hypothetical protein